MNHARRSIALLLFLALAGCQASVVRHVDGVRKHPMVLELHDDDRFVLSRFTTEQVEIRGRCWVLEKNLYFLLPDDPSEPPRFARVEEPPGIGKSPLIGFRLSTDVRTLLEPGVAVP